MQLVVGRIAKAHGIGGEVSVDVHTDDPDHRFAGGASLDTEPAERGPLVVEKTRWHSGRLLVRFAGLADRDAAEALRNTLLVVDSATSATSQDDDEFWDHDLIGLDAVSADGAAIGQITDVLHAGGPDLLVINRPDSSEVLVPFVTDFVPTVDLAARRAVITPPEGLFEL
ncbi:MAG TPA: ribosome maturation factor RimM [Mycobacteriales bacterium]|jgi:16S rRNA processing protein RimM|nr:ribosome maturation factor RimM [Mycobacteriales bacterium]